MNVSVILHNIRSRQNVGAIFRTADGAGVSKIYLPGYSPSPIDRFGRVDQKIHKTALGATETVAWERCEDIHTLIKNLKTDNVEILSLEQHADAITYMEWKPSRDTVCIVGNEIEGVPTEICETSDAILHIPMHGAKESLNVSTAAGVFLFYARSLLS